MNTRLLHPVICMFVLYMLAATPVAAEDAIDDSNKWRIKVDGGANSSGEMVFHVAPLDGEAIVVRVAVDDGTGENRVAKRIRDAFKTQLSKDHYKVEVDDGEDVLVKKKRGTENFGLTLVSSTVKHTKIKIRKE